MYTEIEGSMLCMLLLPDHDEESMDGMRESLRRVVNAYKAKAKAEEDVVTRGDIQNMEELLALMQDRRPIKATLVEQAKCGVVVALIDYTLIKKQMKTT
jgi:hypothetical protein